MSKRREKTGGYSASKKTYSPRSTSGQPRGTSGGSGVRSGVRSERSQGSERARTNENSG